MRYVFMAISIDSATLLLLSSASFAVNQEDYEMCVVLLFQLFTRTNPKLRWMRETSLLCFAPARLRLCKGSSYIPPPLRLQQVHCDSKRTRSAVNPPNYLFDSVPAASLRALPAFLCRSWRAWRALAFTQPHNDSGSHLARVQEPLSMRGPESEISTGHI